MSTHCTALNGDTAARTSHAHETNATQPKNTNMEHIETTSREPNSTKQRTPTLISIYRDTTCNHSNDILVEIKQMTDLDRCTKMNKRENESPHEFERRYSTGIGKYRCEVHKKEDVYGKGSIIRKRVDVNGGTKQVADLKFKCIRSGQEWMEAIGRTTGARVRAMAVMGLLLTMLATSAAAPARSRPTRYVHHEKSARSYLERFGYLNKGRPEVGNLLMEDTAQYYEDDFRIAIKTLQEFGGIPVTGELDEETKALMKQKRCGRPDREEWEYESGHRKKGSQFKGRNGNTPT